MEGKISPETSHRGFKVASTRGLSSSHRSQSILSVAIPAEPRGEKNFFFVQILGGEKLLKFVEKCR